jgi:hypothetical protein
VSFLLDADDVATAVTAVVTVAEGQYGGTFGTLAVATATWPIVGTPTFPAYTDPAATVAEAAPVVADTEATPATV